MVRVILVSMGLFALPYLVYANVKTMLEYREDLNETRNNQFAIVLRAAF